jgi:hypothetical protein
MFTSVQESMFQGPIWGEIVPAVVFHFPTGRAQATNLGAQKVGAGKVVTQNHSWEVVGA